MIASTFRTAASSGDRMDQTGPLVHRSSTVIPKTLCKHSSSMEPARPTRRLKPSTGVSSGWLPNSLGHFPPEPANAAVRWRCAPGSRRGGKRRVLRQLAGVLSPLVLVFVLLAPLSALMFRFIVSLSGDPALSDQDILFHILSPAGFIAFVVIVSVVSIIVFLEYAALITAAWLVEKGSEAPVLSVLSFLAGRAGRLFGLAAWILLRVLLYTLPFLALLGGIYWALISEFDINYYLSNTPTEWYTALALACVVLLGWGAMILYLLSGWIFALPLLLLSSSSSSYKAPFSLSFSPALSLSADSRTHSLTP